MCISCNPPRLSQWHSPPTSSLFLLFLFLSGPSSFSVRRPSPNLLLFYPLPVHAASRSPSPSTSRHLVVFYLLPKSIPIRQRLHSGGSTAGTGPSRKDSLKRQPTPATPMPVAAAAVTAIATDLQLCFNLAGYTLNSS